jgi:hypothetical protein
MSFEPHHGGIRQSSTSSTSQTGLVGRRLSSRPIASLDATTETVCPPSSLQSDGSAARVSRNTSAFRHNSESRTSATTARAGPVPQQREPDQVGSPATRSGAATFDGATGNADQQLHEPANPLSIERRRRAAALAPQLQHFQLRGAARVALCAGRRHQSEVHKYSVSRRYPYRPDLREQRRHHAYCAAGQCRRFRVPGIGEVVTVQAAGRRAAVSTPAGLTIPVGTSAWRPSHLAVTLSVTVGPDVVWSGGCATGGWKTTC